MVLREVAMSAAQASLTRFGGDRRRLMDMVQELQRQFAHVPDDAIAGLAAGLGIHAAEIRDMISFYAFLNRKPHGRFHIRLSNTPISRIKGAGQVAEAFSAALGIRPGETTPDQLFTLDWTADLGLADQEPSALINGTLLGSLNPDDAIHIVSALKALPAEGFAPWLVDLGPAIGGRTIASGLCLKGPVLFAAGETGDGVREAVTRKPEDVIREITASRLRGRGGAGFPTGLKWKLCRQSVSDDHFVVCNADEGEPGTFKDRVLLNECPDLVFDGMVIAGYALGARQGLVYLRGEYASLYDRLNAVLDVRRQSLLLGKSICGVDGFDFDIHIQLGAGAYVCGEESALLESLEGKRGVPRDRPPFPTDRGYSGKPTAVDNVETFATAARIMERGAAWFAGFGTRESSGTKLLSVSGDCDRPGVYEVAFGMTINEMLDLVGVREAAFVQVGGPSGQTVAPKDFGRRIAFEDLPTGGSMMVFGPGRDPLQVARQFARFFSEESCGWCTPCRVGTTLIEKLLDRVIEGQATLADVKGLADLCGTVARMSRCGLGQTAPNPVLSTLRNLPEEWERRLVAEGDRPLLDLEAALVASNVLFKQFAGATL